MRFVGSGDAKPRVQESHLSQVADTDVAIRAVVEGWTAARAARSLDLGWLILKQIDQHVFCDTSPPTRLAILRAMRLNMLVSTSCNMVHKASF